MLRERDRGKRTYALLIQEIYINNLSGTDGHRITGRTFPLFLSRSFSQAETISWSIAIQLLNYLMNNTTQVQTRTGKYPFLSGQLFFIALMPVNHSEKWQEIITFPMRLYGVLFGQFVSNS